MDLRKIFFLSVTAVAMGCSGGARRAPALSGSASVQTPAPVQRDVLRDAGDATWRVVTAPVRLVTPGPKVKAAGPVVHEPPAGVISARTWDDGDAVTGPATSQPGTP